MYSLRVITEHETTNISLGDSYTKVDRFSCKNFKQVYKDTFGKDEETDENSNFIVSFIIGEAVYPIYSEAFVYIVGPRGDTYECVNNPNKIGKKVS